MIQANELKIGNWILNGSIPTVIDGIGKLRYLDPDGDRYDLDCVSGIPLTPEVFERWGFEQTEYMVFKDKYHTICLYSDGYAFFNGAHKIGVGFKYLHTFQNVFFAYTGKELEIKKD